MRAWVAAGMAVVWAGCDCYSSRPPDDPGGIFDDDDDVGDDDDVTGDDGGGPETPDAGLQTDAGAGDGGRLDAGTDASAGGDAGTGETLAVQLDETISSSPRAAIDADGNATVVWERGPAMGIVARRWEAGAWAETEQLGARDEPRVDVNDDGAGVATFRDDHEDATLACLYVPGAGWLSQETIGPGGGDAGAVAIDGAGNVVALFTASSIDPERVYTVRYEPASGWGDASLLEPSENRTRMPDVAANEAGDFAGVWTRLDFGETVWASRGLTGRLFPVQVGAQDGSFDPQVALDAAGDALVVFGSNDDEELSVMAAWQPAGAGEYEEPEVVGSLGGGMQSTSMSSDGNAYVAWVSGRDALVARRDPVGGWGAPEVLDDTAWAGFIAIAADDEGGAIVAWVGDRARAEHVLWSRYDAAEGWTAAVDLDPQATGSAGNLSVDAAPDGTAVIAWTAIDGLHHYVWAAIVPP